MQKFHLSILQSFAFKNYVNPTSEVILYKQATSFIGCPSTAFGTLTKYAVK